MQRKYNFDGCVLMLWLVLEAVLAAALLLFVVWWTWPREPRDKKDNDKRD